MCGIIGLVAKKFNGFMSSDRSIFTESLICDALRGPDSTGVFGVEGHSKEVYVLKQASHPMNLIRSRQYPGFEDRIVRSFSIVVGHNRKATSGSISNKNTHPFVEDNIVMVHNGTIWNKEELSSKALEVDSQAICHSLAEKGVQTTIEGIRGAFALVWYNRETDRLYLIRNEDRPLYLLESADTMFFCSEAPMMDWICRRNGVKINNIMLCKPGVLHTISMRPFDLTSDIQFEVNKIQAMTPAFPARSYASEYADWPSNDCCDPTTAQLIERQADPVADGELTPEQESVLEAAIETEFASIQERLGAAGYEKNAAGVFVPSTSLTPVNAELEKQAATAIDKEPTKNYNVWNRWKCGEKVVFSCASIETYSMIAQDRVIPRIRLLGKIQDLDVTLDVRYMFPTGTQYGAVQDMQGKALVGEISQINFDPKQEKRVLWISHPEPVIEFKAINGVKVNQVEWEFITRNLKCHVCDSKIYQHLVDFTSVKRGEKGFKVKCGACCAKEMNPTQKKEMDVLNLVADKV